MTVRCRGTCKAGHTTEAEADAGRVTWHGQCATEGCDLKVYCRRVPADTPPPPPDTRVAESDPHRVLEVPGYRDEPAPPSPTSSAGDDGTDPAGTGAGEPAGAGETAPATKVAQRRRRRASGRAAAAPPPPVAPTPPRPERPRGLVGRFRARLAEDDDADEERLFGHW